MIFQILSHKCSLFGRKMLAAIAVAILVGAYAPDALSQDEEQSRSNRQMLARRAQEARKKEIITQGELVQWLSGVVDSLDREFPGGAGAAIHASVDALNASSSQTDANKPVESTQLQTLAPLFRGFFQRIGYPEPAAWTNLAAYKGKSVPITVAQAEALFSFDFTKADAFNDLDHNGIADWWERYFYPEGNVDPKALAARGDGRTILEAFEMGGNPLDF